MTSDNPSTSAGPSRRRLIKHGLLATTGVLLGGPHAVGASASPDETAQVEVENARGMMFPYQFTPNARFTIIESDLDWRPGRIDSAYETHVIQYEYARSLRAFLFTEASLPAEENRTFEFGPPQHALSADSGRRLVGVTAESDAR
ncbi:hypothetical protein [Halostagnicola sp. A-GB9-2]|uniref:hypothetical protein n=1 Tax=Halostagnicola sp. A-GB9-2 TaxID=3048066 RepID=UPI0024BFD1E4|nr:hypothetical protein [Halostagnicola sp. A-GB9-2]MDJ1434153.1 hypothetical protein [Halostagnicola sp. A-GB9-2]